MGVSVLSVRGSHPSDRAIIIEPSRRHAATSDQFLVPSLRTTRLSHSGGSVKNKYLDSVLGESVPACMCQSLAMSVVADLVVVAGDA